MKPLYNPHGKIDDRDSNWKRIASQIKVCKSVDGLINLLADLRDHNRLFGVRKR